MSADLCLRQVSQLAKRCGVMHGQMGEHFAINLDIGQFQTVDELTVTEAIQP